MDANHTLEKLDAVITSFQNSSLHLLSEKHFTEFEQLIQQLPDADLKKSQYFQQAGEALSTKMLYSKAEQYIEQGLSLARQQKKIPEQALALGALAEMQRVQGNYRAALACINEALALLTKTENDIASARLYILAGLNDISLGMHESAEKRFNNAYQAYRKLDDKTGIALALIRLGTAQMMQENYSGSEKNLKESLKLSKKIEDKHLQAGALTNLGEIYRITSNYEKAQNAYAQANQLFQEMKLWRGAAITMNNMAHISVKTGAYEEAQKCYQEVFKTATAHGLIPEMMDTLAGIALLLHATGKKDIAQKIVQKLINTPTLLDESRLLLKPLIKEFQTKSKAFSILSLEELQKIFTQALDQ